MNKSLKVLLLEDIQSLGRAGDIVTCSEGLARNKLFPQGQAALATPEVESQQKAKDSQAKKGQAEKTAQLRRQAEKLDGTELIIEAKTADADQLYGSIAAKDIAATLNSQAQLKLKPKQITGQLPIKKLGAYDIKVELSPEVEFTLKLSVEPEAASGTEGGEE